MVAIAYGLAAVASYMLAALTVPGISDQETLVIPPPTPSPTPTPEPSPTPTPSFIPIPEPSSMPTPEPTPAESIPPEEPATAPAQEPIEPVEPAAPPAQEVPAISGDARCSDFSTWAEAQAALPNNPQLDGDDDGVACESL